EAQPNASRRIAIDDLGVGDQLLPGFERDTNKQRCTLRQSRLRVHVKAADAYVLRAGNASHILAVEKYVNNQSRAIITPPLVGTIEAFIQLINHGRISLAQGALYTRSPRLSFFTDDEGGHHAAT